MQFYFHNFTNEDITNAESNRNVIFSKYHFLRFRMSLPSMCN